MRTAGVLLIELGLLSSEFQFLLEIRLVTSSKVSLVVMASSCFPSYLIAVHLLNCTKCNEA